MSGYAVQQYGRHRGKVKITTYAEAAAVLKGRESKKVGNNTYLHPVGFIEPGGDNVIGLRLHQTTILKYHTDGCVQLASGGWQSVTTKARMNQYCPQGAYDRSGEGRWTGFRVRVSTQVGKWYVHIHTESGLSRTVHFAEGMLINPDGRVLASVYGGEARQALLPDADPVADLREYRRERAEWRRRYIDAHSAHDMLAILRPERIRTGGTDNLSERAQVEAELEHRDEMWRAQQLRQVTDDPENESKVYVPEFARGNGEA